MVDAGGVRPGADVSNGAFFPSAQDASGAPPSPMQFEATLASLSASSETAPASAQLQPFQDEMQAFDQAVISLDAAKDKARDEAEANELVEDVGAAAKAAGDDATPANGRSDRPAADGTFGKREYTAADGDRLSDIAADYGQTVDDLLLTNPNLTKDSVLAEGQVIAIYDQNRLEIAKEMAATSDPGALRDLIRREILYATSNSATPADLLPGVQLELLQRRGVEDAEFSKLASDQSVWALDLWTRQGRTHEVMDRLQLLAERGDREGLKTEIQKILRDTAIRSPTYEAVESQIGVLLQYGPQNALFADAVSEAADFLDYGKISEAAQHIAETYESEGPLAAAALLANYTRPSSFDPLSASLLLYAAGDTISAIISHLGAGDQLAATDGGMIRIDMSVKEQIFGYLSQTVTNVSDSPVAADAITRMAQEINVQMYSYVISSMASGDGVYLPVEMLRLAQTLELYGAVGIGLGSLNLLTQISISSMQNGVREIAERPRLSHSDEQQDSVFRSRTPDAAPPHEPVA